MRFTEKDSGRPRKEPDKCIVPGCGRERRCRGLCNACYGTAAKYVHEGKTTWEDLEARGKVLPRKMLHTSRARDWFLGSKKIAPLR